MSTKNTQTLTAKPADAKTEEVIKDSVLASNLEKSRKAQKEAYDAWLASLPVAEPQHVEGICEDIKDGTLPSTSVPSTVSVGEKDSEVVYRIDKKTAAHEAVQKRIALRKAYLKSKRGRAKVDGHTKEMICTSFTLRTSKQKDGSTKAKANVLFES